ncbi:recombinase family protein [Siphonobacter sp. SORGH_AS_1065]|uniref:recombinase family protein n=1 Tax=Siphonobacter sp. SORGH_AS_1065 TaxID=3041795 RepID=UPI00278B8A3F|nr:recombinase family protein [Siphonobacter sp. SORGH_AS_1065]MDQ1089764.1 DNA invertase Pin-like site-specific DNA recombinase [Siphonobacter sp. SORGH_AS_1065]
MVQSYVAYFRVSTQKQGRSGLGLEAQRSSVDAFTRGRGEIIADFTDIESGKKADRPQLLAAIAYCKSHRAVLLIAKLDRLTRNVAFIFALRDSGVEFVCADMPEANTLTIGVMATMAQYERELIAERTRKALAEKRKMGVDLGSPKNLTESAKRKGKHMNQVNARADENNRKAGILAQSLRKSGHNWSEIALLLNEHCFKTRRGKRFQAVQVQRVVKLMDAI